jgi:hypothetical protein
MLNPSRNYGSPSGPVQFTEVIAGMLLVHELPDRTGGEWLNQLQLKKSRHEIQLSLHP